MKQIVFAILVTAVTAGLMSYTGRCLKTPSAPKGIVSLELAWSNEVAEVIRKEWRQSYCIDGKVIDITENKDANAFCCTLHGEA